MARRQSVVQHQTDIVQGEGSFVELSALKYGEWQALRDSAPTDEEAVDIGADLIAKHVINWNWVDDHGEPLPTPHDEPDVIGELTMQEMELLGNLLVNPISQEEAKN